jgi:hypothetical protein
VVFLSESGLTVEDAAVKLIFLLPMTMIRLQNNKDQLEAVAHKRLIDQMHLLLDVS